VRNRVKFHYARNRPSFGDAISHPSRLTTREEVKGRDGRKDTLRRGDVLTTADR